MRAISLSMISITVLFAFSTRAQQTSASKPVSASEIFARSRSSVVVIFATDKSGKHEVLGSGFIVKRNEIATNHHVLAGMDEAAVVFSDGEMKSVSGVAADSPEKDLIVVTCDTGHRLPLPIGDELSLDQGSVVYALGAPQGLDLSLTDGIVSSFRNINGQFMIQDTAPISHGSSGGPLFDTSGRVVGITSSMLENSPGIYFAIGAGDLKRLLRTPNEVNLSLDAWASQQNDKPAEPSHSSQIAPDKSNEAAAPNQPPSALIRVSPLRVGYTVDLVMAGNRLTCSMDGPTTLECKRNVQDLGYIFDSFLTAMIAQKRSGTTFLMGCPPSVNCPPLVPGDYPFEEAGSDSVVIGGLVAETGSNQSGTTGIYSILAYEDSSPAAESASSGSAATALQIFESLPGADQAYVRTFCDENPDEAALVPEDHPSHVINCKDWKAAETGK